MNQPSEPAVLHLKDHAPELAAARDGIDMGIGALEAALAGLAAIEDVLSEIRALAAAGGGWPAERIAARVGRIDELAAAAAFSGRGLIRANPDTLEIKISETSTVRQVTVAGAPCDARALGLSALEAAGADGALSRIEAALSRVRTLAKEFSTQSDLLRVRRDFAAALIDTLAAAGLKFREPADLSAADAEALAGRTGAGLGGEGLAISGEAAASILNLF